MQYLPLFLLFFAALAFGWFYFQRAKSRNGASPELPESTPTTSEVVDRAE
jgi:hypothetical protein